MKKDINEFEITGPETIGIVVKALESEKIRINNLREVIRNQKDPDLIEFGKLIYKASKVDTAIKELKETLEYDTGVHLLMGDN